MDVRCHGRAVLSMLSGGRRHRAIRGVDGVRRTRRILSISATVLGTPSRLLRRVQRIRMDSSDTRPTGYLDNVGWTPQGRSARSSVSHGWPGVCAMLERELHSATR